MSEPGKEYDVSNWDEEEDDSLLQNPKINVENPAFCNYKIVFICSLMFLFSMLQLFLYYGPNNELLKLFTGFEEPDSETESIENINYINDNEYEHRKHDSGNISENTTYISTIVPILSPISSPALSPISQTINNPTILTTAPPTIAENLIHIEHKSRGMVLCSGVRSLPDAFDVVDQVRNVFNSTMNISIVHCNEIPQTEYEWIESNGVTSVVDICKDSDLIGHSEDRLRSWWCKTAALLASPYVETMVVDLDVVWYRNPEKLFQSPTYLNFGSTFFRDRVYLSSDKTFQRNLESK